MADQGANVVCKRLRAHGYEVLASNPNADQVEGDLGYVWMHRLFGQGSVSAAAAECGRHNPVTVGCALMFPPTSDGGHRVMRWFCSASGNLPRRVR